MEFEYPNVIREKKEFESRFWEKVDKKGEVECWNWLASKRGGYGSFSIDDNVYFAHRIAYNLVFGKIPEELLVCHRCDNPICVNPNHLFLGTYSDNRVDMINKGRSNFSKGESHYNSRLTWDIVNKIRERYMKGGLQIDISKEFNIPPEQICNIINNKKWKDEDYKAPAHKSGKDGEHNSSAKLTWKKVDDIRKKYKKGILVSELAKEYSVGTACIYNVLKNKTWIKGDK